MKQSSRINKITMNEPGQERRAIIKWHKLSFRRCVLFVAPQRLHSGAASLTGLIKPRASRTSEDATHLHFVFVSFVFALTGPDFKTRPQLNRFGLVCAAKAGTTSLLPAIFIVYRSRGLVAHANPRRGLTVLIAAIFLHLVCRFSRSSEASRRKLRSQTNSSVKGKTMLNSTVCG